MKPLKPTDEYETPQPVFDKLNEEFGFDLDLTANAKNYKCPVWFGPGSDTIEDMHSMVFSDLLDEVCWMNPPYSDPYPFCKTAYAISLVGGTVVALLNCGMNTKWFHEFCMKAAEIRFCDRRIQFWKDGKPLIDPKTGRRRSNDRDSMIVVWEPGPLGAKQHHFPRISTFEVPEH